MSAQSTSEGFVAFAAAGNGLRFTDWLRARSEPLWTRMTTHRFTREIADDSLAAEAFQRYLVYEHAFVETAVTIFGYALVRAPSIAEQTRLVTVLGGLTGEQIGYFQRVFDALGVSDEDRAQPVLPPAVRAFRDGMLAVAAHGEYEEILAAMVAAEWMYLTWSRVAHRRRPRDPRGAEWVALHVAPDFAGQVDWMRQQLDWLGPMLAPFRQERAAAAFRRTLELEIDFHDAPYAGL